MTEFPFKTRDVFRHLFYLKPDTILDRNISCEFICKLCLKEEDKMHVTKASISKGYSYFLSHVTKVHKDTWRVELQLRMNEIRVLGPMDR